MNRRRYYSPYVSDEAQDEDEDEDFDAGADVESEIIDEIAEFEDRFEEEDCISGKYYIGTYNLIKYDTEMMHLIATRINIRTFYTFTHAELSSYAYFSSLMYEEQHPNIHIMQLVIEPDDTFTAIIKTFWLKIIQRTWKKACQKRKYFIEQFKSKIVYNINNIQLNRKINHLQYPTLRGLLSQYSFIE